MYNGQVPQWCVHKRCNFSSGLMLSKKWAQNTVEPEFFISIEQQYFVCYSGAPNRSAAHLLIQKNIPAYTIISYYIHLICLISNEKFERLVG